MADNITKSVLLRVDIQDADAVKKAAALREEIKRLKEEQKLLDERLKNDSTFSQEEYGAAIVKNSIELKVYQESLRNTEKELANQVKATNAATGSNNQLRAQLSNLTQQYNALSKEERTNTEAGRALQAQIKSITDELKANESAVGDNRRNVGDYAGALENAGLTVSGLRQRIAELKTQIENTDINDPGLADLNNEVLSLQTQLGQATGALDEFGNREPKNAAKKTFEDALASGATLINVFSLIQGATDENSAANEVLASSVKAVAVAQTVANIAKEKGAIIDTATLIGTKALTIAQRGYAIATGTATGVTKLFRVALFSLGIPALVAGIILLILNFDKIIAAVDRNLEKLGIFGKFLKFTLLAPIFLTIEALNFLGEAFGFINPNEIVTDTDQITESYNRLNEAIKRNNDEINNRIRILKAQGASEEEVAKLQRQALNDELNERKRVYDIAIQERQRLLQANGQLNEQEQKLFQQAVDDFKKVQVDLVVFEETQNTEERNRIKKQNEERLRLFKERQENENKLRKQIEETRINEIKDEQERERQRLVFQFQQQQQELSQLEASEQLKAERLKQLQQKLTDDLNQLEIDRQKKLAETRQKEFENSLQGQIKSENERLNFELQFAEASIKNQQELDAKKLELTLASFQKQLDIVKEFAGADGLINNEERASIEQLSNFIDEIKNQIDSNAQPGQESNETIVSSLTDEINRFAENAKPVISGVQDLFNGFFEAQKNQIQNNLNEQISAIEQSTLSEEEKEKKIEKLRQDAALKEYEIQKAQFDVNQAAAILNTIINTAQAVIAQLANPVPFAGPALAAFAAAQGAVQLGIIASTPPPPKPKFFDGGFTGDGSIYSPSLAFGQKPYEYHQGEYMVPNRVLNDPLGGMLVSQLENIRLNKSGGLPIGGFADGGFTANSISGNTGTSDLISSVVRQTVNETVKNIQVVTKITDINRVSSANNQNIIESSLI